MEFYAQQLTGLTKEKTAIDLQIEGANFDVVPLKNCF